MVVRLRDRILTSLSSGERSVRRSLVPKKWLSALGSRLEKQQSALSIQHSAQNQNQMLTRINTDATDSTDMAGAQMAAGRGYCCTKKAAAAEAGSD